MRWRLLFAATGLAVGLGLVWLSLRERPSGEAVATDRDESPAEAVLREATEANERAAPPEDVPPSDEKVTVSVRIVDGARIFVSGAEVRFYAVELHEHTGVRLLRGPGCGTHGPSIEPEPDELPFEADLLEIDGPAPVLLAQVTSDRDGIAKLDVPADASVSIFARRGDLEGTSAPMQARHSTRRILNVHAPSLLTGVVRDRTGRPIASGSIVLTLDSYTGQRDDQLIAAEPEDIRSILSLAPDGRFRVPLRTTGHVYLSVSSEGYVPTSTAAKLRPGEETHLALEMDRGHRIDGRVSSHGAALQRAKVVLQTRFEGSWTTNEVRLTSSRGEFHFAALRDGEYRLRVSANDHMPSIVEPIRLDSKPMEIQLSSGGAVEVSLKVAASEQGDRRARLQLSRADRGSQQDDRSERRPRSKTIFLSATGTAAVSLTGLRTGSYDLVVASGDLFGSRSSVLVREGRTTRLSLDVPDGRFARLEGRVTSTDGSKFLEAEIEAEIAGNLSLWAKAGEDGRFAFPALPSGAVELFVTGSFVNAKYRCIWQERSEHSVTVPASGTLTVEVPIGVALNTFQPARSAEVEAGDVDRYPDCVELSTIIVSDEDEDEDELIELPPNPLLPP